MPSPPRLRLNTHSSAETAFLRMMKRTRAAPSYIAPSESPTNDANARMDSIGSTRVADEDLEAYLNEHLVPLPNGHYLMLQFDAACIMNDNNATNPDATVSEVAKQMASNVRSTVLRENVTRLNIVIFSILGRSIVRACRDHEKDLVFLAYPSSGKSTIAAIAMIDQLVFDIHAHEWATERNRRQATTMSSPLSTTQIPGNASVQATNVPGNSLGRNASSTKITPLLVHLLPTEEGAIQIAELYKAICRNTGLNTAQCYGGEDNKKQLLLAQQADVIIATPGRLFDWVEKGNISFKRLRYVCFDEADRLMLSQRKLWQPNDPTLHKRSQMWDHTSNVFTTVPRNSNEPALENALNGLEIKRLFLTSYMQDKWMRKTPPFRRSFPNPDGKVTFLRSNNPVAHVNMTFVEIPRESLHATNAIARYIKQKIPGKIMIFSATIQGMEDILRALQAVHETRRYDAIHSGMLMDERNRKQAWFETAQVGILVASQTVSHSVNIAHLNAVVALQPYDDYWEWDAIMGRGGRRGVESKGYTFHHGEAENAKAVCLSRDYELANNGRDVTDEQWTG